MKVLIITEEGELVYLGGLDDWDARVVGEGMSIVQVVGGTTMRKPVWVSKYSMDVALAFTLLRCVMARGFAGKRRRVVVDLYMLACGSTVEEVLEAYP